jgi:hypothetical protein
LTVASALRGAQRYVLGNRIEEEAVRTIAIVTSSRRNKSARARGGITVDGAHLSGLLILSIGDAAVASSHIGAIYLRSAEARSCIDSELREGEVVVSS